MKGKSFPFLNLFHKLYYRVHDDTIDLSIEDLLNTRISSVLCSLLMVNKGYFAEYWGF